MKSKFALLEMLGLLALVMVAHADTTPALSPGASPGDASDPYKIGVPVINTPGSSSDSSGQPKKIVRPSLKEATGLMDEGKYDEAAAKVTEALELDPADLEAYVLRGSIYLEQKKWDLARQDFVKAQSLDGKNSIIKFNLVEIDFMQKNYSAARPGFLALQDDTQVGDMSAYRVFLCDLFGGNKPLASHELDAFNKAGSKPSYYFSNVAWDIANDKPDDARSWLASATRIYPPWKNEIYSSSLKELGLLPLPTP